MNIDTLKNHISLTSCNEVAQIAQPIFNYFPIVCFKYTLIKPDGSRSLLCSLPNYPELMYYKWGYINNLYTPVECPEGWSSRLLNLNLVSQKCISKVAKHRYENQLLNQISYANLGNELCICRKSSKLCEYFEFIGNNDDDSILLIYDANIDLFYKFVYYFLEKAQSLIKKLNRDVPFLPLQENLIYPSIKINHRINSEQSFLESIHHKRYYVFGNNNEYLTQAETRCLKLLKENKSARAIAEKLFISKRTVEEHFTNIKNKLECDSLIDLCNILGEKVVLPAWCKSPLGM